MSGEHAKRQHGKRAWDHQHHKPEKISKPADGKKTRRRGVAPKAKEYVYTAQYGGNGRKFNPTNITNS